MSVALFEQFKNLGLPLRDYAIFGSGPLAIRGVIPACADLDVVCRGATWKEVQLLGETELLPEYGVNIVALPESPITFGTEWGIGDVDIDELIDTAETIDGLLFAQLKFVVRYKMIRGNVQDRLHLEALEHSGLYE